MPESRRVSSNSFVPGIGEYCANRTLTPAACAAAMLFAASSAVSPGERAAPTQEMELVDTPKARTIAELVEQHGQPIDKTVKTLIVHGSEVVDHKLVALLVRGDHELNPEKPEKLSEVASPLRMATEAEIRAAIGAGPGSIGPVGLPLPMIADRSVAVLADFSAGANIDG